MSDDPVLGLLRDLKTECPRVHSALDDAERSVRHVAFMDQVVKANRRRARLLPSALGLAAAAALTVLAFRFERLGHSGDDGAPAASRSNALAPAPDRAAPIAGSLRILDDSAGAPAPLLSGESVNLGPKSQAVVQLANGALATLAEQSSLTLEGTREDPSIRLTRGRVELSVPPLSPHSLSVVTLNARVTVVGTKFSVTVESGPSSAGRTCVNVVEGRVSVASASSTQLLGAGAHWSSDTSPCAASSDSERAARAGSASARNRAQATSARTPGSSSPPNEPESAPRNASALAEQNRLFAAALRARERGELAQSRASFGELIARCPDAALAPQARRELAKLDRQLGATP